MNGLATIDGPPDLYRQVRRTVYRSIGAGPNVFVVITDLLIGLIMLSPLQKIAQNDLSSPYQLLPNM
ncbi:MAG: hypothetical protein AB8H12_12420 [Lewinella sp.]